MRVQLWLVHVSGSMSIVMDEAGTEVPSEGLTVYKTSLFLDTSSHSSSTAAVGLMHTVVRSGRKDWS